MDNLNNFPYENNAQVLSTSMFVQIFFFFFNLKFFTDQYSGSTRMQERRHKLFILSR